MNKFRIRLITPCLGVPSSFIDSGKCAWLKLVAAATSPLLFSPTKKYQNVLRHNTDGTTTKLHINCNQQATIAFDIPPKRIYFTASNAPNKYLFTPYSRVIVEVNND